MQAAQPACTERWWCRTQQLRLVAARATTLQRWLANPACLAPALPRPPQVMGIRACISDPSLAKFDVQQCGGLLRMLDAVNLGNTNPAVSCELSCVEQFAKVGRVVLLPVVAASGTLAFAPSAHPATPS